MKNVKVWIMAGLAFGLGCSSDSVKDFIPGMYVNAAAGEYAVARDTLVVELVEGNNYLIHRRTGFNVISNGKLGTREYETEEWRAVYSLENHCLTELRKGKMITFFPDRKMLMVSAREYNKVN